MSWPSDGLPRYVASPAITGGNPVNTYAYPEAYVYDRAYCHAIVCACSARTKYWAESEARRLAARFNAEDAA